MRQWHTTQTQLLYQAKLASSLLGHGSVAHNSDSAPIPGHGQEAYLGMGQWHTTQTQLLYRDKWARSLLGQGSMAHNSDSAPIPGQMGKKLTLAWVSGTQLRLSSYTRTNWQVAYLGMGQWHTSQTQLQYQDKWVRSLLWHGSVANKSVSAPLPRQMGKELTLAWVSGTQLRLSSYTRTNGQVAYLGMSQWLTGQTQLLYQDEWARSLLGHGSVSHKSDSAPIPG